MATPTYTPIASITLGSSASSVTFSSIPQDYRDLVLVASGKDLKSDEATTGLQLNNDSANHDRVLAFSEGGSHTNSNTTTNDKSFLMLYFDDADFIYLVNILDYSDTSKHTSVLWRANSPNSSGVGATKVLMGAGRYTQTTAITQASFQTPGSFQAGTTFALYGIEA